MIVVERTMLDLDTLGGGREQAVPGARRAVIGGHADCARIVPEPAVDHLGEGNAAMPADDTVCARPIELLALHRRRCRGEDETVDLPHAAMDDGEPPSRQLDIEPARQTRHPDARLAIEMAVGMGVP